MIYFYQGKKKKKKKKTTSNTSKEKPLHRCNSCHQACANGGSCFYDEDNQRSHCVCALGWTGQTCLENINDCEVNQCQHGAACEDGMNEYRYKHDIRSRYCMRIALKIFFFQQELQQELLLQQYFSQIRQCHGYYILISTHIQKDKLFSQKYHKGNLTNIYFCWTKKLNQLCKYNVYK